MKQKTKLRVRQTYNDKKIFFAFNTHTMNMQMYSAEKTTYRYIAEVNRPVICLYNHAA